MKHNLYNYKIVEFKVHDGDTLVNCKIDFGMYRFEENVNVRLYGIDTPEVRRNKSQLFPDLEVEAGKLVAELLSKFITTSYFDPVLQSVKQKSKYSSILGILYLGNVNINDLLVELKLAYPYTGGKKEKWTKKKLNNCIEKCKDYLSKYNKDEETT
jgi:endonuclease YncB( thermonuclease family)